MRKTIFLSLIIFLFVISSCTTTKNAVLDNNYNDDNIIYVGAPLSFTGKYASLGADMRNGISLALDDLKLNNLNNYNFKIIYEDTKSDPKTALTIVNKLVNIDHVNILMGPISSLSVLAIRPLTEENKIVLLAVTSAEEIIDGTKYIIRNRETGKSHAKSISEFIFLSGKKRVGILNANSPNAKTYAEWTEKYLLEKKLSIVAKETYDPDLKNHKTIILKVLQKNPDVLYIAGAGGIDAGLLVKELKELGYEGEITGSGVFGLEEFLTSADSSAEGVFYSYFMFDEKNQIMNSFIKKYETRYNVSPSNFAAIAYDNMMLLSQAITYCNGNNSDCIINYFHQIKNYNGVSGITNFDDEGNANKIISVMTIHNGQRIPV